MLESTEKSAQWALEERERPAGYGMYGHEMWSVYYVLMMYKMINTVNWRSEWYFPRYGIFAILNNDIW